MWKTGSYPYVECDGLPLFETQVQFGSWISELGAFADFILLFHPSAGRQIIISTDTEINYSSQQFPEKQHAASSFQSALYTKPPRRCLLEMVLQSHIEVKGVPSVPEANSYESTATCRHEETSQWLTWSTANRKFLKSTSLNGIFISFQHSHPHRCHPVSVEQSIGWNRWLFPLQCRDTP